MGDTLRHKTVRGMTWSIVGSIVSQGITFLVGIVLARLLSPSEFGLIGLVTIFTTILGAIADSGFTSALIRKKEVTHEDYNTVFFFNLMVSVLLALLLSLSARGIATFFDSDALVPLLRVMSLVVIVDALCIVQRTHLTRAIDFKSLSKVAVIAALISGAIGLVCAYLGCGVWSLVAQQLSRQTVIMLLLWVCNRWKPQLRFSYASFKELFGYGSKMLAAGLIDTIWKQAVSVVIGKFYTPANLGQYTRAIQFANLPSVNLMDTIQRVSFPVLGSIQDEPERLKSAYKRLIRISMFISFCLLFALAAVSRPLVITLVGQKWSIAADYLPILCCYMVLYPLHAINLNMLQVKGRSGLFLKTEVVRKLLLVPSVLLGVFYSIPAMLWAQVVASVVCYYVNAYYSGREVNYGMGEQIRDILPSLAMATVMYICMYAITFLPISNVLMLFVQTAVGLAVIGLLCVVFQPYEYRELRQMVSSRTEMDN